MSFWLRDNNSAAVCIVCTKIIRIYKTVAVLSYGSEAWTIRRTDDRRVISAEIRFLRWTAGYTGWDHKK
jgi:hypothetical protein